MDLFKRITDLLTPPPHKQEKFSTAFDENTQDETPTVSTANLGRTVKALVTAPALEHPQATEAIAELKQIAASSGLYVVASKMRYQLDAMPRIASDGSLNWKDRAYVLAADFIYQHISRDIRGMEIEGKAIGPNIFRSYCNELIACLLYGKNARRAIEMPVLILEDLLHLAVASAARRDFYLELADVAINATVTQTVAKLESDLRERNRRRQEEKRGDIPSTPPTDTAAQLDSDSVLYAKQLQERIDQIRRELTTIRPVPVPRADAAPEAARTFAEYLQTLIAVADRASYAVFSTFLQIHLAGLLGAANPADAAQRLRHSADTLINIASEERTLHLTKLSARRLTRAAELYAHLGDQAAAQECRARAAGR
ncbi:MAG: hypothetical protein AMXMBFR82_03700 [Candidatus Hydrogenedentota bacterium]